MQETNTKQQILELLKEKNYGLTIEEVSCELKISRSTGSKYLAVLEAERKVVIRSIGKAKLHYLYGNYNGNGSNGHLPANGEPMNNGIAVILLAFILFFAYAPTSTSASQNYFLLSTDKGVYGINNDVYIYISGPTNTAFTVKVYGPDDVLVSKKTDKTSGMGSAYMHYTGFSITGAYRAELEYAGGNIVKASFSVAGPGTEVCENCKPRIITTTSTTYETTNVMRTTSTASSAPVSSAPTVTTGASAGTTATTTTTTPTTTPAQEAGRQKGIPETGKIPEEPAKTLSPKARDINITGKDVGRSFRLGGSPRFEFTADTGRIGALSGPKDLKALIRDSEDIIVGIEAEVNQTPDGDYAVSLPDTRAIRPGAYKVSLDTGVYGGTTPAVQNFLWGLVSVNTKKSTYKPGEKAEFVIVVLNEEGRGLCDTDVWLNVTSPDGTVTALSKQDGTILVGDECGLYTAAYTVESDGEYIVNASARVGETVVGTEYVENPGAGETEPQGDTVSLIEPLVVSFDTSFQAAESYPYDIIRTADSKIDPTRWDVFQVRVDLQTYAGARDVTVRERVPSVFEVTTDGDVLEVGDEKILSWEKSFSGGAAYINYSYSVPHEWPMLYELGPLEISGDGGNYMEARPWYVAVDPVIGKTGMAVYQLSAQARVPAYMNWSEGLWNAQGNASNVSNIIQWVVLKDNPVREEKILATLDSASNVQVQIWNSNHTWSVPYNLTQKESNNTKRGLDVAVEQVSGDVFVFYNNGSAGMVAYRVWNGNSWSGETNLTYNASTPAEPEWIKTATVKGSDRMMVVVQTENTTTYPDIYAIPWDGTNWMGPFNLEDQAKQTATECVDVAFMETSKNALVAWGDQALLTPSYRNYTYGKGWSAEAQATSVGTASIMGVRLAPMPGSDRIMMCILEGGTGNDIHCQEWSGIAMRTMGTPDASIQLNAGRRNYDVKANMNTSGYVLLYGDSGDSWFDQAYCSSLANCQAGTWTAAALWAATSIGTSTAWGQLYYTPNRSGEFVALMQGNAAGNGWWKGRFFCNVSGCVSLETPNNLGAASSVAYEGAMFAVDMYQANYPTNLTLWDETNKTMFYANQVKYINQSIMFYANYTNITGTPVNSTYSSDAKCNISIYNITQWTPWYPMTFNSTKSLYQYNLTGGLSYPGTYQWNVSCNATGYAFHQDNTTVYINNTMPVAVIDWPKSADWVARWNSTVSLRCNASDLEDPITLLDVIFQWDASSGYSSLTAPLINNSATKNPFIVNFNAVTDPECSAANIGATGRCYYQCYSNDSLNGISTAAQNSFRIDGEAPTSYSTGIQGYAVESWLTGTAYTVLCSGATDPNSGSGVSSYDYEYTSADDCLTGWGAIAGCTDVAGNCAWNTPPADEAGLCLRCRATDAVGNNGTWDNAYYAGTDNTPPGTCAMTRPLAFYNITSATYTLASDESDAGAGIRNVTFQYFNGTWQTACVGTASAQSYNCSWNVPAWIENWRNISIQAVCFDNVSLNTTSANVSNITIDAVNTNPSCVVSYPNGGENVSGTIIVNATAGETDPTDYVNNVSFNYSSDGGSTWTQIGTNKTQGLSLYGISWDSSALNGNKFEIRCTAADTRNGYGSDDSDRNFTVDNLAPNGYSAGIAGYARDSWLTTTSFTVQCLGATDNGGSGVATYDYEYTTSDDCLSGWGAISGCTDIAGDCAWNTPPANEVGLCVRCRATDVVGINGTWDQAHYAGTDDTPPSTCSMTRPLSFYNITSTPYVLASDESDPTSGIKNVTFEYYDGNSWQTACAGTNNAQSYNCSWSPPAGIEDWENISIKAVCYNNASLSTESQNVSNLTIDVVNVNPTCSVIYPDGGENFTAAFIITVSANETDPSDRVNNLSYNYSLDGGASWSVLGTNLTPGLGYYSMAWNLTSISSGHAVIRCIARDGRGGLGLDDSDANFTVDMVPPAFSKASINQTQMGVNQHICLNVTVSDLSVDSVWAELDVPDPGLDRNISLEDDGLGCDKAAMDGVYSAEYTSSYDDMYNWTRAYANDSLGNYNYTKVGLNWSVSSTASINTSMERPTQDFKVNESTGSRSYNYTQGCNVSCGTGGTSCDNVVLYAQYKPLGWEDITTTTPEIINGVDSHSCGTLTPGQACRYNYTITPANYTGGDSWLIRCRATSTTASQANSNSVTLTINTMPDVAWTYPATDGQWLHGVEYLGASATDSDGTIASYLFELDNNSAFTSPVTLCSGVDDTCAFDTGAQTECVQNDNTKCFLRVTAIDNDGGMNSTVRIVGIDNMGPSSSLDKPVNYENISASSYKVNASVSDQGIGSLSSVSFEYRPNPSAAWSTACTDIDTAPPYECVWDISGLADGSMYEVRVKSIDTFGNVGYDTHTGITLDRTKPAIVLQYPLAGNTTTQTTVNYNFTAVDNLAAVLNCSLYIDSVPQGTNSSARNNTVTNFTVAGISEGVHSWYVNCSDYSGNMNKSDIRSFTVDHTNPAWNFQNQTINGIYATVAHRGDIINLSSNWTDNILLDSAFLSTNETGAWQNKSGVYNSPQQLFGTNNQSVFPWTTASIAPGTGISWMIYANDTTGNINNTALMNYTVWGYSKVSALTLSPSTVNQGSQAAVLCRVVDNVTGAPIANYPVSFYNATKLMGINKTGSDGWSAWNFTINSTGTEQMSCNITHNDTLYYNISNDNMMLDFLTIQQIGPPIFYRIISDPCEQGTYCRAGVIVYNPNPTIIHVQNVTDTWSTDYVNTIRQCCTPDGCNVAYCGESPGGTIVFKNQSAWNISAYGYQIFWYEMGNTNVAGTPNLTANVSTNEWPRVSVKRPSVRIINTVACAWTSWSTNKTTFDTNSSAPSILHVDAGSTTKFTVRLTEYCGQRSLAVSNNLVVTVPVGWTYVPNSANWTSNNAGCIYAAATRQIKCILPAVLLNAYNNISFNLTAPSAIGAYNFTTMVNGTDAGAIHSDNNTHMVLVRDYSAPNALNNGSSNSSYHRGTPINLYANWTDNYKLDAAVLSTNESGIWDNKTGIYGSPDDLGMVNNSWSNYTWLNDTLPLGTQVFWRIYANDSTGNTNGTVVRNFTVWGYSASMTYIDKSSVLKYNPVNVYCFVGDTFNGSGIHNYPVRVYSNTTLIANGSTTYGWFNITYVPEVYGTLRITCNISDNSTLFYNASSSSYSTLQINDSCKFNLTVTNSTNNSFEGSAVTVYDSAGNTLASASSNISVGLEMNKLYDIGLSIPVNSTAWMTTIVRSLNLSTNLTLRPQVVTDYAGTPVPANISGLTPLFAINDSFMTYNHTELYIPRGDQDEIVSIMHCPDWSFLPPDCPAWEMFDPEDYNMQENDTSIWFNVTHFTSFGGGAGNPLPNVTQIAIYDVTGLLDTHTGGTLIGSGLNRTFYFLKRVPKMYRVEFTVRNDGLARWTIAAGDDVHHEKLNDTWLINNRTDIWYNIGGTNYSSGNWSGGKVVWNTSKAGQLNRGSTMTFDYVFNMTSSYTEVYNTYFLCNDTSAKSGSYDYDKYNITRLGYFEFQLALPPQIPGLGNASNNTGLTAYMVGANRTFAVNATLYCRDGFCGMVNGTLRYNKTSANPDTPVNTTLKDKPFYVMDSVNPKNCGNNPMKADDYCNATWLVNATDVMHSIHKLDVQFLSNYSLSNDTADVSIEVTKVLIIDLSWDVANFGVCNPMSYGNPALLNAQGYNITVDNNSNDVDGLYIKGTDLGPVNVSVLNGISYGIGVGNMTWYYLDNYSKAARLTDQYYLMNQSLPTSTVVRNYYWIDIPRGQYTQDYAGKLYIMANASV